MRATSDSDSECIQVSCQQYVLVVMGSLIRSDDLNTESASLNIVTPVTRSLEAVMGHDLDFITAFRHVSAYSVIGQRWSSDGPITGYQ
jgi:hypothetical protein